MNSYAFMYPLISTISFFPFRSSMFFFERRCLILHFTPNYVKFDLMLKSGRASGITNLSHGLLCVCVCLLRVIFRFQWPSDKWPMLVRVGVAFSETGRVAVEGGLGDPGVRWFIRAAAAQPAPEDARGRQCRRRGSRGDGRGVGAVG